MKDFGIGFLIIGPGIFLLFVGLGLFNIACDKLMAFIRRVIHAG